MTILEDDRDMLRRYGHKIRRIGNLGHEGAVLAEGRRELQSRPGRPAGEYFPHDDLVVRDIAIAAPARCFACIVRHGLTVAIIALSRAPPTAATEKVGT